MAITTRMIRWLTTGLAAGSMGFLALIRVPQFFRRARDWRPSGDTDLSPRERRAGGTGTLFPS